jgi:hypothetical protein
MRSRLPSFPFKVLCGEREDFTPGAVLNLVNAAPEIYSPNLVEVLGVTMDI